MQVPRRNPFRVQRFFGRVSDPRVARGAQPWAKLSNAVGVQETCSTHGVQRSAQAQVRYREGDYGFSRGDQNSQLNSFIDSRAWTTCRLHIRDRVSFAPGLVASWRQEFRKALMFS